MSGRIAGVADDGMFTSSESGSLFLAFASKSMNRVSGFLCIVLEFPR